MEKAELEKFVGNLKKAGIDNYVLRYEGGNRMSNSNSDTSQIRLTSDYAVQVEMSDNPQNKDGRFLVKCIPYSNIDTASSYNLTIQQTIDYIKAEGVWDKDMESLIKNGGRVVLQPGVGGYGEVQDKDGNPVLQSDLPGRITTGFNK